MAKRMLIMGLLMLFIASFTACNDTTVYDQNRSMENNVWMSEDIKTFEIDVTDTISPLNIFVNLRTTTDYEYSNIYVFLYSEFPDGNTDKDTLEFLLSEPDGKWLGENSGTVVEFKGLIASGGRFSTAGKYTFKMQHAMRENELREVIDIGIAVERIVE